MRDPCRLGRGQARIQYRSYVVQPCVRAKLQWRAIPFVDAINALLTSLPAYDANIITSQLDAGNLLGTILDPMSANTQLVLNDLILVAVQPLVATLGTAVNLAELFS